jgi:hypothetical protein
VVSGALVERTASGGRVHHAHLPAGGGRRFGAHRVHGVANRGAVPAISIHVYAPALRSMTDVAGGFAAWRLAGLPAFGPADVYA